MQLLSKVLFLCSHFSHQGVIFLQQYLWKRSRQPTTSYCDFSDERQALKTPSHYTFMIGFRCQFLSCCIQPFWDKKPQCPSVVLLHSWTVLQFWESEYPACSCCNLYSLSVHLTWSDENMHFSAIERALDQTNFFCFVPPPPNAHSGSLYLEFYGYSFWMFKRYDYIQSLLLSE